MRGRVGAQGHRGAPEDLDDSNEELYHQLCFFFGGSDIMSPVDVG